MLPLIIPVIFSISISVISGHVCIEKPSTETSNEIPSGSSTTSFPSSTPTTTTTSTRTSGSEPKFEGNAFNHGKKMVCYYGSWAVYRPDKGKYPVENIDPFLCTHLIYTFAGLGYDNKIRSLDPWNDLRDNYGKGAFERFTNLKQQNGKLKTLLAIGGWNEGSIKYSSMAASPETRRIFIDSVVEFLDKYNFDGLDLDWEYPAARRGKGEDKGNFASLVRELKTAFRSAGKDYLLTAAVSAGKWFIDPGYDVPEISRYLDFINVMCYDYHGGWEDKTGHNAPIYARPEEEGNDRISNVNFSLHYWIEKGAPPEKIILGMATYGRSFTLQREENHGYGAPAPQKGQAGPYTREPGSLGYNEICEAFGKEKWTVVDDPYHLAPYAYRERQWVSYDNIESIATKARMAMKMGLGGGMVWSLETDDFQGDCHGVRYPLIKTINRVFSTELNPVVPTPPPTPVPTDEDGSESGSPSSSSPPPSSSSTEASSSTSWWQPSSTEATSSSTWWSQPSSSTPWWATPSQTSSTTSSPSWERESPSSTKKPVTPGWEREGERDPSSTTSKPSTPTWWKWTSTTSSTTTPPSTSSTIPPRRNEGGLLCRSAGMFRHPNDCKRFYRCVDFGIENRYMFYEYNCPSDTVFDEHTKLCLWADSVPECSKNDNKDIAAGNEIEREDRSLF